MSLSKFIVKIPLGRPLSSIYTQTRHLHSSRCQCSFCYQRAQLALTQDSTGNPARSVHSGQVRQSPIVSDPENKGKRQKGVNFDTLGSWNNRLDLSISVQKSIEKGKLIPEIPLDEIGTVSLIGRRKVNEDRYVVEELTDNILYFGVFDGHGGSFAVEFVHQYMSLHLRYWLNKTRNLFTVLEKSFIDVNNLLARHITYYSNAESSMMTGTTATVCLLRDNIELVVGHVGDTRAILCREGESIRLSHDHHPDDSTEALRIKSFGGHITENSHGVMHVNGRLTMTRSIGDFDLKPYGVTASPFIRSIEVRHGKDSFLVLTSDGLSFVLSDQELMDIICSCNTPEDAAYCITDQALQFGSEDNVTAVVIPFGAWGKYKDSTRSIPYSFGRNFFSNRY